MRHIIVGGLRLILYPVAADIASIMRESCLFLSLRVDASHDSCHKWDPMSMISPCRFADRVPSAAASSSGFFMTMTIITITTRLGGASG